MRNHLDFLTRLYAPFVETEGGIWIRAINSSTKQPFKAYPKYQADQRYKDWIRKGPPGKRTLRALSRLEQKQEILRNAQNQAAKPKS